MTLEFCEPQLNAIDFTGAYHHGIYLPTMESPMARAGNILSTAATVADVKCLQVVDWGVQRCSTGTFSTGKWEYHEYKMGILL